MIKIIDPADCCGCSACQSICPKQAISMKPDSMGFLYPEVDNAKCVDCGLCDKVCSFNDDYDKSLNLESPEVYGARHKNINEVETSRSGAVFISISDWILKNRGAVYGAGFTDHFRVVHKRAITKEERDEFKGSKYVQSDLQGVFLQVKDDLKNGMIVLFSGTPCQTSGLNAFVGTKYRDKLYLVDIVCHGVPSPFIWRDYISFFENKYCESIVKVSFRDKEFCGWADHKESFSLSNGKKIINKYYTDLFYDHIMFRHSCGNCHFCNTTRPSDITIADFWGWEKTDPNINIDDKGLSLVLVNTEKGRLLWEAVKNDLNYIPAKLEDCLQPNLQHPSEIHPERMKFEEMYKAKGFEYVMKKYCDFGFVGKLKVLKRRFVRKIKSVIKRLLGR